MRGVALLVVLTAVRDVRAGIAGDGERGEALTGVAPVAVGTLRYEAALDLDGVHVGLRHVLVALGDAHLGEQDHWTLVTLGPVQRVNGCREALGDGSWSDDRDANITVARAERGQQVRLLGLR